MPPNIVILQMPMPSREVSEKAAADTRKIPVETQIKDMIDCIESGESSAVEWITLNKLYGDLKDRKDPRALRIKKMIEPTLAKYGQHGTEIR